MNQTVFTHKRRVVGLAPAKPPMATEQENDRLLPKAVQVILYSACLHSALYDLMQEMESIGEYRHAKKRYLNECINNIGYIHESLHKHIGAHSDHFGRWYNDQLEKAEQSISEHILLEAPHRAYNIVMALFRLVESANNACGVFKCPAVVVKLPIAKKMLERCNFPIEDKGIDRILEMCIDTDVLTRNMKHDKLR